MDAKKLIIAWSVALTLIGTTAYSTIGHGAEETSNSVSDIKKEINPQDIKYSAWETNGMLDVNVTGVPGLSVQISQNGKSLLLTKLVNGNAKVDIRGIKGVYDIIFINDKGEVVKTLNAPARNELPTLESKIKDNILTVITSAKSKQYVVTITDIKGKKQTKTVTSNGVIEFNVKEFTGNIKVSILAYEKELNTLNVERVVDKPKEKVIETKKENTTSKTQDNVKKVVKKENKDLPNTSAVKELPKTSAAKG